MRARVPYLTRLAGQATGQATLLPPRQLFAGDIYTPVRSPGRDDSLRRPAGDTAAGRFPRLLLSSDAGVEPPAQPGIAFPRGVDASGDRAPGTPAPPRIPGVSGTSGASGASGASAEPAPDADVPVLSAPPAARAKVTGIPAAPGGPDVPGPPDVASHSSPATRTGSLRAAGTSSVAPAQAGRTAPQPLTPQSLTPQPLTPQPVTPQPSSSPRPAGDAARAQPPGSWTSPLWGTPADLPQAIEPSPLTGEKDRRDPSRPGAAAPPPGPGPAATAGPHQDPRGTEAGIPAAVQPGPAPAVTVGTQHGPPRTDAGMPAAPGSRNAGQERSGEPTAVRDLRPLPGPAARPIAMPGPEPGGQYQRPRVSGPPRVSIGTIDVTVLPPAPPAPPAPGIRPPAQVARGWTRPPSLLAATAGADRRRDGLRRWYGTAQG